MFLILKLKLICLQHLLKNDEAFNRLIIFCKTKTVADNIYSFIERRYGAENVRVNPCE
jgi:ATP-dependent RNA helicase RhlE